MRSYLKFRLSDNENKTNNMREKYKGKDSDGGTFPTWRSQCSEQNEPNKTTSMFFSDVDRGDNLRNTCRQWRNLNRVPDYAWIVENL